MVEQLRIGCAGWTIPKLHAGAFATSGSHLARYGRSFSAVEINSSFHRPHRRATYERWAATVPPGFAFAVKAPRAITHELRLGGADAALDAFLTQACGLGEKLGPLLFQLPPSLAFEAKATRAFFAGLRARFAGDVVCEPRHSDWFAAPADDLLREFRVGRAAADPPVASAAADPGGYKGLQYYRLHGSPRIYYSQYGPVELDRFARQLIRAREEHRCAWCIFDNTASGAAIANAIALRERVKALSSSRAVRLT